MIQPPSNGAPSVDLDLRSCRDGIDALGDNAPRLTPINGPSSLREQAYEHIKAAIVAGNVEVGPLYSVQQFAQLLGVSRTPVREALLDLARQGLLRMDRNRGFRVLQPTREDLDEIVDLRRMLEVPAMERLAVMQPRPERAFAQARKIYEKLQESADSEHLYEFLALDRQFHLALVSAVGNARLTRIVGELRDHTHLPGLRSIAESHQLHTFGYEHLSLLLAIETGDAASASRIMHAHLDRTRADWA